MKTANITPQAQYLLSQCLENWEENEIIKDIDSKEELQDACLFTFCNESGNMPNGEHCGIAICEEIFDYLSK